MLIERKTGDNRLQVCFGGIDRRIWPAVVVRSGPRFFVAEVTGGPGDGALVRRYGARAMALLPGAAPDLITLGAA
jgi:hypothetical protein